MVSNLVVGVMIRWQWVMHDKESEFCLSAFNGWGLHFALDNKMSGDSEDHNVAPTVQFVRSEERHAERIT